MIDRFRSSDYDIINSLTYVRRSVHILEVFDKALESIGRLPCNWH